MILAKLLHFLALVKVCLFKMILRLFEHFGIKQSWTSKLVVELAMISDMQIIFQHLLSVLNVVLAQRFLKNSAIILCSGNISFCLDVAVSLATLGTVCV